MAGVLSPGSALAADVVFTGGAVHTVDGADTITEGLAVRGGRVLAAGDAAMVARHVGRDTRVVDLLGRSLVPGFIDNHIHLANATQRAWVDVSHPAVGAVADLVARIAARASVTPTGAWVLARGFDTERLAERRMPTRHDLDAATTAHPVGVANREGMGWTFNTAGLRAIGVTDTTTDVPGGPMVRDDRGRPLGPMWDNARTAFVYPNLPFPTVDELADAYAGLALDLAAVGVTTAFEAAYRRPADAAAWRLLHARSAPTLRVVLGPYPLHGDRWDEYGTASAVVASGLATGFGDPWLRLGAVQVGVDGGILGRTAALDAPYAGVVGGASLGSFRASQATLAAAIARASGSGWQVALVCHGDAGIERALAALEEGLPVGTGSGRRSRLEHAYLWNPRLMDRAAGLGIVWNTQPAMLGVAGPGATLDAWGDRARYAFPFRSLHERGVTISSGSDWGVGPFDPIAAFASLVTHRFEPTDGGAAFNPGETLTVSQALRVLTRGGAQAGFLEDDIGSLVPGMRADLAILDADLRATPPDETRVVRVDETWVDGRRVFQREAGPPTKFQLSAG